MAQYQQTFVLRKIDPVKVVSDYNAGKFFQLAIPTEKVKVEKAYIPTVTNASFSFRDKNNCLQIIETTNNEMIKKDHPPRCLWCMEDMPDAPTRVPCPVEMYTWLDNDERYYLFVTSGEVCCFECLAPYISVFRGSKSVSRSPFLMNSEVMMYALYWLVYPERKGEKINPAPDYRLCQTNGGTLSNGEYHVTKSVFIQTPNLFIQNACEQFIHMTK